MKKVNTTKISKGISKAESNMNSLNQVITATTTIISAIGLIVNIIGSTKKN